MGDESTWTDCWNWNLCYAAYGSLVLDIKERGASGRTYDLRYVCLFVTECDAVSISVVGRNGVLMGHRKGAVPGNLSEEVHLS